MSLSGKNEFQKEINIKNNGTYKLLTRTFYNGVWRGEYTINLDGHKIINFKGNKTRFGWGWQVSENISLKEGARSLKLINVDNMNDIDSIVVISEKKYENIIDTLPDMGTEINKKQCISGFEFEHLTGFENISEQNAISGGHIKPYRGGNLALNVSVVNRGEKAFSGDVEVMSKLEGQSISTKENLNLGRWEKKNFSFIATAPEKPGE